MPQGPLRLLLVDENSADANLLSEHLTATSRGDLTIVHANTLADALGACNEGPWDAIIVDPDLSGSIARDAVRDLRDASPHSFIVVLTDIVDEHVRQSALASGAQQLVGKNDAPGALLARSILHAIEFWRAHGERSAVLALLERSPDAMIVIDSRGEMCFVNPAAKRLFDTNLEDRVDELNNVSIEPGQSIEIEVQRGLELRSAELYVVDVQWRNEPARLAIVRDVTNFKRRIKELHERQSQAMRELSRLVLKTAHDLTNVLTVIAGGMDLLDKHETHDQERQQIVRDMQSALERATALSRQLLAMSKDSASEHDPLSL